MQESFRAIKGILNIREQGQSLEKKVYCYVIYGNKGMYAMGFRFLEGQDAPVSLTSDWSEFASYVASSWKDPEGTYVSVIKNTVKHFFENTHLKNLYEGSRDGERNLEQKLNMSLDKNLGYSAFSFLKIQKCPGSMVREFLKQFGDPSVLEVVEEEVEEDLQDEEPKTTQDVLHEFIPCSPVIDPVKGKSVASLALGEKLTVKLPQDNKLYEKTRLGLLQELTQRLGMSFEISLSLEPVMGADILSFWEDRHETTEEEPEEETETTPTTINQINLTCGVIVDPVRGCPVTKLQAGSSIYVTIKEGSAISHAIRKVMAQGRLDRIPATFLDMKETKAGNLELLVELSEGIYGKALVTESFKIAMADQEETVSRVDPFTWFIWFLVAAGILITMIFLLLSS